MVVVVAQAAAVELLVWLVARMVVLDLLVALVAQALQVPLAQPEEADKSEPSTHQPPAR